jgi:AcrR family transcriptional regulator
VTVLPEVLDEGESGGATPVVATLRRPTTGALQGMARRPPSKHHRIRWADDSPVDSDDARGRIVSAAVECIDRMGPDKTTMDDVAKVAAITRPTVYKYFPSRNELLIAAFLRVLEDRLDRGLFDFFVDAKTVEDLYDGVAGVAVYILDVLRDDEVIEAILNDSRIPVGDLLQSTSETLIGVMESALQRTIGMAIDPVLFSALRSFSTEQAATWVLRTLYTFYMWPDREHEYDLFRLFLAPAFIRDHL